jgi:hypothetical protein
MRAGRDGDDESRDDLDPQSLGRDLRFDPRGREEQVDHHPPRPLVARGTEPDGREAPGGVLVEGGLDAETGLGKR